MRSKEDAIELLESLAQSKRRAGDEFRAGAYARAAKAVESRDDFVDLVAAGRLRTIPGIGASIERTLMDFLTKQDDLVHESYHSAPFQGAPDLHCHSSWSDGALDVEQIVLRAKALGESAIGITDHSPSLKIARGLSPAMVRAQWAELERVQAKHPDVLILRGTECDILRNGRLDYPDELLAKFDFVVGSLHSQLRLPEDAQTERVLKALDSPFLTVLGHPTTRVPGRRPRANLDLKRVFEKAAAKGVAVEVNGHAGRLDLDADLARQALDAGALLSLGSDGHNGFEMLGLETARRTAAEAGAKPSDVVNYEVLRRRRSRLSVVPRVHEADAQQNAP